MNTSTLPLLLRRALAALVLAAGPSLFGAAVNFHAAGGLPGGDYLTQFRDATLTPSGILAVGTAAIYPGSEGDTPVLWTPAAGWQLLANDYPMNPSPSFVTARVIGANGQVIGGSTRNAPSGNNRTPCLWTNHGTAVTGLGFLGTRPGFPNVGLNGLSEDASVGYGFTRTTAGVGAFRYTAAGGMASIGQLRPEDVFIIPAAHGVSSDGRVVVGNSGNFDTPLLLQAFRYTCTGKGPTGGVMTLLPPLPGGTFTYALALTTDGATAFGFCDSPGYPLGQLVRWDKHNRVKALGSPNPARGINTWAGVTADGKVVASGVADFDTGANGVIYIRNTRGWFKLQEIIAATGIDLTGWNLDVLTGMSADGRLIYGSGLHNGKTEAWVAEFAPGYLRHYGAYDDDHSDSEDGADD